jgi:UDP-N-acetylmuramate--alanine ligase
MNLPPPPAKIFCIGIGGIGVSGLAQLLVHQGYSVAGSDRGLNDLGKEHLYDGLRAQGIRLYAQDGSGPKAEQPDALVISTAVEKDNVDLIALPDCPVIHRATALAQALDSYDATQIAIAGSCGKTSVTGWIAAALKALGKRVLMVDGGYSLNAERPGFPGNFFADDKPEYIVVEVDESDRSLSAFHPHFGVLLNVGNDHYEKDQLNVVFSNFLGQCSRGAVILDEIKELANLCKGTITCFSSIYFNDNPKAIGPANFQTTQDGIVFDTKEFGHIQTTQDGFHSAINACAVLAVLQQLNLGLPAEQIAAAIASFKGIRQRFEIMGKNSDGITVINDFAHNPEKIAAAISAAHDRFGSPLTATFQPHGFTPLRFMREELVKSLEKCLAKDDLLIMLPVFYAGGTASFSPTSDEVAAELCDHGLNVIAAKRDAATKIIATRKSSCILIMGARDASLRTWSAELAAK